MVTGDFLFPPDQPDYNVLLIGGVSLASFPIIPLLALAYSPSQSKLTLKQDEDHPDVQFGK